MSDLEDNLVSVGLANDGSRKRTVKTRKSVINKQKRYGQPKGYNTFIPCSHNCTRFQCSKFTPSDCSHLRKSLLSVKDKITQDNFISGFVTLVPVKRQRPLPNSSSKRPNTTWTSYTLVTKNQKTLTVCKKFFMKVMCVKPTRLRNMCQAKLKGKHLSETRGGDRKSHKSAIKRTKVQDFIKSLKGKESHYNRKKSKRIYLDANLNISKLHRMYNDIQTDESTKVSKMMFRRMFNMFNLGFRSPASDICSLCQKLTHLIRTSEGKKKIDLMTQKRVHKLRAAAFYKLMKEKVDNCVTLCFDLQQIQPLPKSAIQEAYYSRQIGYYCSCIVDSDGSNPSFYVWTEEQAGKGSVEVSSALIEHLNSMNISVNVKTIRLFCDGCGAQNKNNYVLHSLMHFLLKTESKVETIQLIFPVRGHSFLPADRVFGRIEKLLRKRPTIIRKEEYVEIYKTVGCVKELGVDWTLYDTKELSNKDGCFTRLEGISGLKKIFIKKQVKPKGNRNVTSLSVKGLQNFYFESEAESWKTLRKKGWNIDRCKKVELRKLPLKHNISAAKKKDVIKLLEIIFGDDWENDDRLEWYKAMLLPNNEGHSNDDNLEEDDPEAVCDCLEEDCGLHI